MENINQTNEMQETLQIMFVQKNQNKYNEIEEAIASGDTILAHRLSHSLKGNAGHIEKFALQEIAELVEKLLKTGSSVPKEVLERLEAELSFVLAELKPLYEKSQKNIKPLDSRQVLVLFEKLLHKLEHLDPGCLDLVDELRTVPGTEKLVEQIEELNLRAAHKILLELKRASG